MLININFNYNINNIIITKMIDTKLKYLTTFTLCIIILSLMNGIFFVCTYCQQILSMYM
jgi:hypothetical protein